MQKFGYKRDRGVGMVALVVSDRQGYYLALLSCGPPELGVAGVSASNALSLTLDME